MDTSIKSEHTLHDRRRSLPCSNVRDASGEGRDVAEIIEDPPWGDHTEDGLGIQFTGEVRSRAPPITAVLKTDW